MIAVVKNFFQRRWKILVTVLLLGVVSALIWFGYHEPWTGFSSYIDAEGKPQRAKTLWDWMELLIVPTVLGVGLAIYSSMRQQSDRELADDRARETALQSYLNDIEKLMLTSDLGVIGSKKTPQEKQVRALARAKTLTIFSLFANDPARRKLVTRFLADAGLITDRGIDLSKTNLSEVDLSDTQLGGAILQMATLLQTKLWAVNLQGASLEGANLEGADLWSADLQMANLWQAILKGANLRRANLENAILDWASLEGADLEEANLAGASLEDAALDVSTILPDGTKWTRSADLTRFNSRQHDSFWRSSNPDSPAYQDKASKPKRNRRSSPMS